VSPGPALVLHVAGSAGWAGGEVYLVTLAGALDRARFRLGVVVPEPGPLVDRLRALGVPTALVPLAERLVNPAALWALARQFRRQRPAIVQSHGARSNVYTRLAARLAGVPVVLSTVHNSLFDYEVSPARRRAYVAAERWTSGLADRVIAVSGAVARDLVQRYGLPAGKVVVVRNGIDADAFRPARTPEAVRAELGLGPAARPIGVAARMTEQKGHVHLLDALPAVAARVPDVACVLIGDGPLRGALEARARALGVLERCRFTGARSDVADLVAALELVVLPSRSEGLPFALLEAMALGRPVVATAVGGCPEVVDEGRTGLLVPAGDPAALAGAIWRLLERPEEARAMGARGADRVRAEFTLARMVGGLEALYAAELAAKGLD
jgi:glycosyltransferase involved in cell wall biosynthesis